MRARRVRRGGVIRGGALILLCAFAVPPVRAEWRLTKGLEASATSSDNADGAASGGASRAETVLGLAPFVTLIGTGSRHELAFEGRAQLTRFVDARRTTFDPNARVATRSVLIDRFAELETFARVSQRAADGNPLTDDEPSLDARREETWELGINPSLDSDLGSRARVRGDYRFTSIRSSDGASVGSDTHAVSSRLDASLDARDTFAFVATDSARIAFEDGQSGLAASLGAGIGRRFGETLEGAIAAGRDWFRAGGADETLEDTFWALSLRWEPNARVLASLGYGERVYGRKPSASLRLGGRRSSVELAWSRELSLAGDAVRGDTLSTPLGGIGVDTDVPLAEREEGVLGDDEPLSPFARDAARVREQVEIGYALRGRRSTLTASAGWFDDRALDGAVADDAATGSAEAGGVPADDGSRGHEFALGFERQLSARVGLSSRYRFLTTRVNGQGGAGRVRENLVELLVRVRL